jgi:hypothetical protein
LFGFFTRTAARPFDIDAGVNANILFHLGACAETRPVVEFLCGVLRDHAEERSDKWYDSRFVLWYFLSRALVPISTEGRTLLRQRLRHALPRRPIDQALACTARLNTGIIPSDADIARLCACRSEGCWQRGAVYHGGRARVARHRFAPADPWMVHWGSEELSTAFAVEALSRWLASR